MAGILDSKSRVIDAILTEEGRRQLAAGTFTICSASFSDTDVAYIPDKENGHDDPASKIYFEACNLPQDQITFEANDQGHLVPFRRQDIAITAGGAFVSGSNPGTIADGRLTVYRYHHGRTIEVLSDPSFKPEDKGRGFTYSSPDGLVTCSILFDPSIQFGTNTHQANPYKFFIGVDGSFTKADLAFSISKAIEYMTKFGGPEVYSYSQENVVFLDANPTGSLSLRDSFIISSGTLSNPKILSFQEPAIGGRLYTSEVENAAFASQIEGILASSADNFNKLRVLSTIDRFFNDDSFEFSTNDVTFDLTEIEPSTLKILGGPAPSLNSINSLFNDEKLSHLDNFAYLPPIVKISDSIVPDKTNVDNLTPYLLGNYPSWGDNEKKLNFQKLKAELLSYPSRDIYITKSSNKNNIIAQIFEITDKEVKKLDVVDFGYIKNDLFDPNVVSNIVFFAGKNFMDNRGTTCFVNMFTVIFSRNEEEIA